MKIDLAAAAYAVMDRAWTHDAEGLLRQVAAAVDGAGIVQLREKHGTGGFPGGGGAVRGPVPGKGAVGIINDNVDRRPDRGGRRSWARRIWRRAGLRSCWGGQADRRFRPLRGRGPGRPGGGAGLGVGAAFVTGTRRTPAISRETIRAITAAVDIPVVYIGGIMTIFWS